MISAPNSDAFSAAGLVGVHRNRNPDQPLQPLEHRHQPPQFLGLGYRTDPGTGETRADIQNVRARVFKAIACANARSDLGSSPIGKRIGGDIQHANNQRAVAGLQNFYRGFSIQNAYEA